MLLPRLVWMQVETIIVQKFSLSPLIDRDITMGVWKVGSRVLPKQSKRAVELGPGTIVQKHDKVWIVRFDKGGKEVEFTCQQMKKETAAPQGGDPRNPPSGAAPRARGVAITNNSISANILGDHEDSHDLKHMTSRPPPPNIFDVNERTSFDDDDDEELPTPPSSFNRITKGARVRPRAQALRSRQLLEVLAGLSGLSDSTMVSLKKRNGLRASLLVTAWTLIDPQDTKMIAAVAATSETAVIAVEAVTAVVATSLKLRVLTIQSLAKRVAKTEWR